MLHRATRAQWLTLIAACCGLFLVQLDVTVVNVALPAIGSATRAGPAGLQWVVDAYALPFASFMLAAGDLGDLYGRKRVFLAGLALFLAGSVACALAPGIAALVGARAVQGVGAAVMLPGTLSLLTQRFPDAGQRAEAIGLWAGVSGLSLIAGPVLGGVLVEHFGWPSVFWLNLPIGAGAFVLTWRAVAESADPAGRRLDVAGQCLAVVALAALVTGIIGVTEHGWSSPVVLGPLVVSVIAAIGFIAVEHRSPSPLIAPAFFRIPAFTAATVAGLCMNFSMLGTLFVLTIFLQRVQGYPAAAAGLRIVPCTAPLIVLAPVAGRVVARRGSRPLLAGGLGVSGVGLLGLAAIQPTTPYLSLGILLALIGTGIGLAAPAIVAAALGSAPASRAGMASAVNNTARQAGGALGIALIGTIAFSVAPASPATGAAAPIAFVRGFHLAVAAAGAALLAAAVAGWVMLRGRAGRAEERGVTAAAVAPHPH